MTATNLTSPWTADANPPADLESAKAQATKSESKDPHDHSHDPALPSRNGPPPTVYVSTQPAELIQTQGPPQYTPVANANLVYATNTENDLFMDIKAQDYYTLLAGRWYRASNCRVTSSGFLLMVRRRGCWLPFRAPSRPRKPPSPRAFRRPASCRRTLLRGPRRGLVRGRLAVRSVGGGRLRAAGNLLDAAELPALPRPLWPQTPGSRCSGRRERRWVRRPRWRRLPPLS